MDEVVENDAEELLLTIVIENTTGAASYNLIGQFKKAHKLQAKDVTITFLVVWPTVAVKKFPGLSLEQALEKCLANMPFTELSMKQFSVDEAASFVQRAVQRLLIRAKQHETDTGTSDIYRVITQSMAAILKLEEGEVRRKLQNLRRLVITAVVSYARQPTPIELELYEYNVEKPVTAEKRQFKIRDVLNPGTEIASDEAITLKVFVSRSDGSRINPVPYTGRLTDEPLTIDSMISLDIEAH